MRRVTPVTVLYNASRLIPELSRTLSGLDVSPPVLYDGGSVDGSPLIAASGIPEALVLQGPNRGFGHGNNRCFEHVDTEYTLLLNADASIGQQGLENLLSFLDSNPDYAAAQPLVRLWGWPLVTASRGVFLTRFGEAWDSGFMHLEPMMDSAPIDVPAITAAVSLWRTSALRSLAGFDEGFFMYFEDADLSLRAGASGYRLAVVRGSTGFHVTGASSTRGEAACWELASSIRMYRRYLGKGRLTSQWWKRELRIELFMISRGIFPFQRLRTIARAFSNRPSVVELPDSVYAELFGSPLDMPLPRAEPEAPGPGWVRGAASPWAGFVAESPLVKLTLASTGNAVTGAVMQGSGRALKRFVVPPEETVTLTLAADPGVVYIKCDSPNDTLKVVLDEKV